MLINNFSNLMAAIRLSNQKHTTKEQTNEHTQKITIFYNRPNSQYSPQACQNVYFLSVYHRISGKKTRETVITLNGTMDGIIIVSLTANDTNITLAKLE